jgi:hypothetical protein
MPPIRHYGPVIRYRNYSFFTLRICRFYVGPAPVCPEFGATGRKFVLCRRFEILVSIARLMSLIQYLTAHDPDWCDGLNWADKIELLAAYQEMNNPHLANRAILKFLIVPKQTLEKYPRHGCLFLHAANVEESTACGIRLQCKQSSLLFRLKPVWFSRNKETASAHIISELVGCYKNNILQVLASGMVHFMAFFTSVLMLSSGLHVSVNCYRLNMCVMLERFLSYYHQTKIFAVFSRCSPSY